jgi:hypothetical protein
VFILGFPKGISQGAFPIWKRGSIATEPLYGVTTIWAKSGAPVILVDALTNDGMSGSPVLYFGSEVVGDHGPSDIDILCRALWAFMLVGKALPKKKMILTSDECGKSRFSIACFQGRAVEGAMNLSFPQFKTASPSRAKRKIKRTHS